MSGEWICGKFYVRHGKFDNPKAFDMLASFTVIKTSSIFEMNV